jgi:hypothetical protein
VTIHGFFGAPGAGKSYVLSLLGTKGLKRGQPVFSNYALSGAVRYSVEDLPHLPPGLVLLDEAQNFFHSRSWNKFGEDLMATWSQTRKSGWTVLLASQADASVDAEIRRRLQYAWWLEKRWSSLRDPLQPSGQRRPLFIYGRCWLPEHYKKTGKAHRPLQKRRWWYSDAKASVFDTFERVEQMRAESRPLVVPPPLPVRS